MIQASSLRIGNFIADRGGKIWAIDHWETHNKVASKAHEIITEGESFGKGHPLTEEIGHLQPIPLTPEWLERAGFEHLEKTNVWINKIALYQNDTVFMYEVNLFEDSELIPIHYVHDLQNLFYALTGKELEFNLDNLN